MTLAMLGESRNWRLLAVSCLSPGAEVHSRATSRIQSGPAVGQRDRSGLHACRCRACLYTAADCCPGRAQGGGARRRTLAFLPWVNVVMEAARETLRACSLPCFIFRKRGARSIAARRRRDAPTDRNVPEQENKHLLPAPPCAILRCIVWTMSCVACAAVLLEPVSCPLLLVPRRAEAVAAMDVTQTQQQQCHFCKGDLEGVEGDDVTKWLCGHSAHTDCLQENCLRRGVPVPTIAHCVTGWCLQPSLTSTARRPWPRQPPRQSLLEK